jgi:ethanolamine utilization protein EutN
MAGDQAEGRLVKIGLAIGKISLRAVHPSLTGKRWVIVQPLGLAACQGLPSPMPEELIVLDELGATPGGRVAYSEGGEAAAPFHPAKKPVDAYLACLIDELTIDPQAAAALRPAGA